MQINSLSISTQRNNRPSLQPNFKGQAEFKAAREILVQNLTTPQIFNELRFGENKNISKCLANIERTIRTAIANISISKSEGINLKTNKLITTITKDDKEVGKITIKEGAKKNSISYIDKQLNQALALIARKDGTLKLIEVKTT